MKLLFDENLSPRLVELLAAEFPDSSQIDLLGLRGNSDCIVWEYAHDHGFCIVSKDNDFRQRSFLHGAPPKIIWLSVGNNGTTAIAALMRKNFRTIIEFGSQTDTGLLVLR